MSVLIQTLAIIFAAMQLSQAKKKYVRSLALKKNRDTEQVFIAEGEKVIHDLLAGGNVPHFVVVSKGLPISFPVSVPVFECDTKDMEQLSAMSQPPGILAVFSQWKFDESVLMNQPVRWLITDGIKDPGNMGTMIRTAHWFGVNALIAINSCAELYNPKTIQSTMGSLGKLPVFYFTADYFFEKYGTGAVFYGADLEGEKLATFAPQESFALVIGSESHGLSAIASAHIKRKIFIPEYNPKNRPESLNAAVSAGIILSRIAG